MQTAYSIAEARDQFAALIHQVEAEKKPVQVTRRGELVAVILAKSEYERLIAQQTKPDFWQAYLEYQKQWQGVEMDIEDDIWEDVRDRTPPREVNLWP